MLLTDSVGEIVKVMVTLVLKSTGMIGTTYKIAPMVNSELNV